MTGAAIGVIAKAPETGLVKTRLCPPLTPVEAARLAGAMLADTVRAAVATGLPVWCVATGDPAVLSAALPVPLPVIWQRGDGLAERLTAAQSDLFAVGCDRVVLLAGDCPTVSTAYLVASMAALDACDVVLGRAVDGGYSLVGTCAPQPALFTGVPMSTSSTLDATLDAARGAGLSVRVRPARRDLDTVDDLVAAAAEGQLAGAPDTRAALATIAALAEAV